MRGSLFKRFRVAALLAMSFIVSAAPLTPAYATGFGHNWDWAKPTFTDPCGTSNDQYALPSVDDDYKYEVNGDYKADGQPHSGSGFTKVELLEKKWFFFTPYWDEVAEWSYTFTNAVCKDAAASVTVVPPTCNTNGSATYNTTFASLHGGPLNTTPGTHTATFKATTGHAFDNGNTTKQVTYTVLSKTDDCPTDLPQAPTPTDPCGLNNASWVTPADTATYTWSIVNGHLIATVKNGFKFSNGQTSHDFGLAVDSGARCKVDIPAQPGSKDPCGLENVKWKTTPANSNMVTWALVNGNLVATTTANYEFSDGTTSKTFTLPADSQELCPATAKAPYFKDLCGTGWDWYYVPHKSGVVYSVGDTTVTAGWHKVEGAPSLTVTAAAEPDYVLTGATSWSFEYTSEKCVDIEKEFSSWVDTDGNGWVNEGDKVIWKITVHNLGVNPYTGVDFSVSDINAILDESYITGVMPNNSYSFTATTVLTAEHIAAGKVVNYASYVAGFNLPSNEEVQVFAILAEEQPITFQFGNFTGVSNLAVWDFAHLLQPKTPPTDDGEVLGDSTTSGGQTLSTSTEELPETLPATGGDAANPLSILVAALIAYGATYFIQGRRRLAREQA